MHRYKGKVVVITGAGGGFGRASAIRFASEGGSVVAVDLQGEALSNTLQIVKDAGETSKLCNATSVTPSRYGST